MKLVIAIVALALLGGLFWFLTDDPALELVSEGTDERVGSTRAWHYFNVTQTNPATLTDVAVDWPYAYEWISVDGTLGVGDLLRVEQPDPGSYTLRVTAAGLTWTHDWDEPDTAMHIWHHDSEDRGDSFKESFIVQYVQEREPNLNDVFIQSDGEYQDVIWASSGLNMTVGTTFSFEQVTIDSPRTLTVIGADFTITMTYGGGAGTPL